MKLKDVIRKWWFWITIIIFASIIIILLFTNKSNGVGTAGISLEEYNKIELGMTQFEINSIVDTNNEWDDNEIYEKCCQEISKSNSEHVYKYVYKYYGEKNGYAVVTYEVDYSKGYDGLKYPKVTKKEQFNLK